MILYNPERLFFNNNYFYYKKVVQSHTTNIHIPVYLYYYYFYCDYHNFSAVYNYFCIYYLDICMKNGLRIIYAVDNYF